MDAFALTDAERALFLAANRRGLRFIIVGLGAAAIEGAPLSTQDIDLWFERTGDELRSVVREAGGFWIPAFGAQPPAFGGAGLERLDLVLTVHGLGDFATEYAGCVRHEIDGVDLAVLPLERVIVSKRATGRPKDLAALPALEATLRARQ